MRLIFPGSRAPFFGDWLAAIWSSQRSVLLHAVTCMLMSVSVGFDLRGENFARRSS
jgi:hypothetical protein